MGIAFPPPIAVLEVASSKGRTERRVPQATSAQVVIVPWDKTDRQATALPTHATARAKWVMLRAPVWLRVAERTQRGNVLVEPSAV